MGNQLIVYPLEDGIAVLHPAPACGLSLEEIAQKDVPQGVPFKIIDASDLPEDRTFRNAWEADFSDPDGHGDPATYWAEHNGESP